MNQKYDEAWGNLPESLRAELLADSNKPLSANDIAALTQAGIPTSLTYWVDNGIGRDDRFVVSSEFRRFIEAKRQQSHGVA